MHANVQPMNCRFWKQADFLAVRLTQLIADKMKDRIFGMVQCVLQLAPQMNLTAIA